LSRVLADRPLRESLGARAAERAASCTWRAAARQLIAVFDELVP